MKQERIDASQMELLEKVVSIKRVTKVVKLLSVTAKAMLVQVWEKPQKFRKQSAKEKKTR